MPLSRRATSAPVATGRARDTLLELPLKHPRIVRVVALMAGLGSVALLPYVYFDRNTLNLRDPECESVVVFRELLSQTKNSPWSLAVMTPDAQSANDMAERLGRQELVDKAIHLADFIPGEQEEKLALIEEMALIIGPALTVEGAAPPLSLSDTLAALTGFMETLESILALDTLDDSPMAPSAARLRDSLGQYIAALDRVETSIRHDMLKGLEKRLLTSLPGRLRTLNASLNAGPVTARGLPDELIELWVAADGRHRVEVFPAVDLNEGEALRNFVAAVQSVAPDAIGFPVIILEAGDAVVGAFRQALILALIAITVLLLFLMARKSDAFLVLLPLILAGVLTGASSVVLDVPFNFANVIALPLLLGIGVDSGIHMTHRMRTAPPANGRLLRTSTARGVLFSTLTTLCSFGNLGLSPHRGMASMGQLLTLGIGFTLICTLIVLPTLLKKT